MLYFKKLNALLNLHEFLFISHRIWSCDHKPMHHSQLSLDLEYNNKSMEYYNRDILLLIQSKHKSMQSAENK